MFSISSFRACIIIFLLSLFSGVQGSLHADDGEFTSFKDCLSLGDKAIRFSCYETFAKGNVFSQKKVIAEKVKVEVEKKKAFGVVKKAKAGDINEVTLTIIAIKKLLTGKLVFTTSDNQVWEQKSSNRFKRKKVPFQAVIKKKVFSGYSLSPIGSTSSVTVKRVK